MTADDQKSLWMCHVCDYRSNIGEGQACDECYKITCNKHMTIITVLNPDSGLYELKHVCAECQFKKIL